MGTTFVRRGVLAASAVSLCLPAAACDSGSGTGAGAGKDGSVEDVRADAAPGGTEKSAALGRLLVAPADLPEYRVEGKPPRREPERKVPSDKEVCVPLVRAQAGIPIGRAAGTAVAAVMEKAGPAAADAGEDEKLDALRESAVKPQTTVTLDSYADQGAQAAFAAVKAAVAACAGGYTAFEGPKAIKVEQVLPGETVPAGDESLAYQIVLDLPEGQKTPLQYVFVRKGAVLATFERRGGPGGAPQPPAAVVAAQAGKLG
ncbi:hypothetical protein ACGFY6_08475 [Streptomyces sp. NPDC048387]|uniref:hypothetical protein n=1 Tax=Streptomyces sp. NPDC048387 TaxID=3365542 RepID=UPI003712E98B